MFSVKKYPPKRLASISTSTVSAIKSMTTDDDEDKLFAGTAEGQIICLQLGKYGKEKKETKEYSYALKGMLLTIILLSIMTKRYHFFIIGKRKCVSLSYDQENDCLLSGNESGNVAVWHPDANQLAYVFNAHHNRVTSMSWDGATRRLVTGSSDGKIKVWKLPERWVDESNTKQVTGN